MDKIHSVSLRKQGDRSNRDDNACKIRSIEVWLYDENGQGSNQAGPYYWLNRSEGSGAWLGNERGQVIWLAQGGQPSSP